MACRPRRVTTMEDKARVERHDEEAPEQGLLGTTEPDPDATGIDAPWEPSGVKVGVPVVDPGRAPRSGRRTVPMRDPGYVLRGAGWGLAVTGALLYLYAVWSTADRVVRNVADPSRTVGLAGFEVLLGSLALAVLVLGLLVLAVGYLVPPRRPIPTVPGDAEYEAYVDDLAVRVRMNEGARWGGLVLFVVGLLVALYPLRRAADGAALATFDAAGATFHTHSLGVAAALLGAVLFLLLGARQRPLEELLLQTRSHRTLHARRGPLEEASWPEGEGPDDKAVVADADPPQMA